MRTYIYIYKLREKLCAAYLSFGARALFGPGREEEHCGRFWRSTILAVKFLIAMMPSARLDKEDPFVEINRESDRRLLNSSDNFTFFLREPLFFSPPPTLI